MVINMIPLITAAIVACFTMATGMYIAGAMNEPALIITFGMISAVIVIAGAIISSK